MRRKRLIFIIIMLTLCGMSSIGPACAENTHLMITADEIKRPSEELKHGIQRVVGECEIKELDYRAQEAKVWIERLKIDFIPYVIFDKGIEKTDKFFELAKNGMIDRKMGEYIIPERMLLPGGVMFFRRERKPYQLDLFVMSQCPAGNDALRQIGNHIKKNPGAFKVVCHYIVTVHDFGINSLHGAQEIKEDINQLLIQKYYPDKFWNYIRRNQEGKNFTEICKELGIDPDKIKELKEEGIALLKADFNLCQELGIDTSPTFLWENQIIYMSIMAFRQFMPAQKGNTAVRGAKVTIPIPIIVFYDPKCSDCRWFLDEYVPKLEQGFGKRLTFEYYDVSIKKNFEKRMRMEEEFGVVGGAVPEVFIGNEAFVGKQEIKEKLKKAIEDIVAER